MITGPPRHLKKRRYRLWTRKLREFKILQTSYKSNMGILSTEFSTSCGQRLWMWRNMIAWTVPHQEQYGEEHLRNQSKPVSLELHRKLYMNEAFTSMATSLASAFRQGKSGPSTSVADKRRSVAAEVGVSPGRLADLQGKFFDQLEQLHKLFERGTLTEEQFEKRKQVILDRLDELASK